MQFIGGVENIKLKRYVAMIWNLCVFATEDHGKEGMIAVVKCTAWEKFRPERDSNPWPLRYCDKVSNTFHILKVTVNFPGVNISSCTFLSYLCSDFWLFNTAKNRNSLFQAFCWISTQSIVTSCVSYYYFVQVIAFAFDGPLLTESWSLFFLLPCFSVSILNKLYASVYTCCDKHVQTELFSPLNLGTYTFPWNFTSISLTT